VLLGDAQRLEQLEVQLGELRGQRRRQEAPDKQPGVDHVHQEEGHVPREHVEGAQVETGPDGRQQSADAHQQPDTNSPEYHRLGVVLPLFLYSSFGPAQKTGVCSYVSYG